MDAASINAAIAEHGAAKVYAAATKHMAGQQPDLSSLGLRPKTLRDVYDALSEAYNQLGEADKAIDAAQTSAALKRFEGRSQ